MKNNTSELVSRSFVTEQFLKYKTARELQHKCERNRYCGSFGIAVDKDELALEWQKHTRDVEQTQAFFESRRPIPERWGEKSVVES